jgi:hypothetical protein
MDDHFRIETHGHDWGFFILRNHHIVHHRSRSSMPSYITHGTRPGKHTKNYGKIHPFFVGKLTISMAIFNSKLLVYQRVTSIETSAEFLRTPISALQGISTGGLLDGDGEDFIRFPEVGSFEFLGAGKPKKMLHGFVRHVFLI